MDMAQTLPSFYGHMHNRGPTIRFAHSGPISKCALYPIARFFVIREQSIGKSWGRRVGAQRGLWLTCLGKMMYLGKISIWYRNHFMGPTYGYVTS